MRAGEDALAQYEQQTRMQQQAFQQNLQTEINKANAQTAEIHFEIMRQKPLRHLR